MSKIKTGKKELSLSYIASLLNSLTSLLVLPFILSKLSTSDVGIWYVFISISSFVGILDFGFSPTIIRNITYCWSGSNQLFSEGLPSKSLKNLPNYSLLKSLLIESKKVYYAIAISSLLLLLSIGTLYISTLLEDNSRYYFLTWVIFSTSVSLNLYYSFYNASLRAIGSIKASNIIVIISRLIYLLIIVLGLLYGYGILTLSIANIVYTLIFGFFSKNNFKKKLGVEYLMIIKDTNYSTKKILNIILPNAKKAGIVSIITFVMVRLNSLLAASFLGLEISASYSIVVQLFSAIGEVSKIFFNTFIPKLTSLLVEESKFKVRKILSFSLTIQWIVGFFGLIVVIILLRVLFSFLGSDINLTDSNYLLFVMAITFFLGWNHSTFATYITLSNTVPFIKSGIISSLFILIITIFLLQYTELRLWALVLPRFFVSLAYDNWKWPLVVFRELDLSVIKILKSGLNSLKGEIYNGLRFIKL